MDDEGLYYRLSFVVLQKDIKCCDGDCGADSPLYELRLAFQRAQEQLILKCLYMGR